MSSCAALALLPSDACLRHDHHGAASPAAAASSTRCRAAPPAAALRPRVPTTTPVMRRSSTSASTACAGLAAPIDRLGGDAALRGHRAQVLQLELGALLGAAALLAGERGVERVQQVHACPTAAFGSSSAARNARVGRGREVGGHEQLRRRSRVHMRAGSRRVAQQVEAHDEARARAASRSDPVGDAARRTAGRRRLGRACRTTIASTCISCASASTRPAGRPAAMRTSTRRPVGLERRATPRAACPRASSTAAATTGALEPGGLDDVREHDALHAERRQPAANASISSDPSREVGRQQHRADASPTSPIRGRQAAPSGAQVVRRGRP